MDATTWYGNQTDANVQGRNIGTLAVIAPLLERMKVAQIIDQHLPADPQAEYGLGTILSVLVAARMHSPVALVNVGRWAAESGADLLWNVPEAKLNDDRLGKALDKFFTQRHSILTSFALHVSEELGVPLSHLHYDPTHILFHGAYEESEAREAMPADETIPSDDAMAAAHITKGRRMEDAAHGGRMVHAGICTHVDEFGPLPIYGHTVGGNQNGPPGATAPTQPQTTSPTATPRPRNPRPTPLPPPPPTTHLTTHHPPPPRSVSRRPPLQTTPGSGI